MAPIRKYSGIKDVYWDCFADFATDLNDEFNKLGLRDDIRMDVYESYLEGEALGFFKHLKSSVYFLNYEEMCSTLSAEFTKLELQMKSFGMKERLDALQWNPNMMSFRDFADGLRAHVLAAFPFIDKTAQEDLMCYYLRQKTNIRLDLPMWLKYDQLVKAMTKVFKKWSPIRQLKNHGIFTIYLSLSFLFCITFFIQFYVLKNLINLL